MPRDRPTDSGGPDRQGITESPGLKMLWETMAAAQSSIADGVDEAQHDLAEVDRLRPELEAKLQKAIADEDEQAYQSVQADIARLNQAERVLRRITGDSDEDPHGDVAPAT